MENLVYRTFIFELLCLHVKYLVMLRFRYNYFLVLGSHLLFTGQMWRGVIEDIERQLKSQYPRLGYWYMGIQFRN